MQSSKNERRRSRKPEQITADKIQAVIKKLLTHKSPGPGGFTEEFYKTFKEELTPILLKLFKKIQKEGGLPKSFYKPSIILTPKPDKNKERKKTIGSYG